jgi:hypothetical protein
VSLRVAVDGNRRPQIDVPLGSLFGDGLETRTIHSLAFGMSPADHSGYFALPIPFRDGASVSLRAQAPATVALEAPRGAPLFAAGTLYGKRRIERSMLGRDYRALDAHGSGRVASLVDEILDGGINAGRGGLVGSPDQRYMEGDDRVYVDGSSSPSIYGTGTEDIFNGGWYFGGGAFALPLSGAGPLQTDPDGHGARSMYRVFAGDGVRWGSQIRFGIQHGGGDDRIGETVAVTTFSYRWAQTLAQTDTVTFADHRSTQAHGLHGAFRIKQLRAYFEGEINGNGFLPSTPFGLRYPAPPPAASPESVAATGIAFSNPISVTLTIAPSNVGVVMRRLLDQSSRAPVSVSVDGRPAGRWEVDGFPNPAKRWLEADYDLPSHLTARKRRIRVTLTPQGGVTATAFRLRALSRFAAQNG